MSGRREEGRNDGQIAVDMGVPQGLWKKGVWKKGGGRNTTRFRERSLKKGESWK